MVGVWESMRGRQWKTESAIINEAIVFGSNQHSVAAEVEYSKANRADLVRKSIYYSILFLSKIFIFIKGKYASWYFIQVLLFSFPNFGIPVILLLFRLLTKNRYFQRVGLESALK